MDIFEKVITKKLKYQKQFKIKPNCELKLGLKQYIDDISMDSWKITFKNGAK